ncbi:MAG: UvrD-helicase domain-containing protein [Planctomycetes bacterium]|nr:UvrD-helicase domain-containing protein [Planctomycetota bacterium]
MKRAALQDQRARDRAAAELGTSFLVEAGAGTGKTSLLVRRLVNLVADGVELSRLAAITFTEKAAAELKVRFRDELEQEAAAERAAGREERAERLDLAVEELEGAAVTTIHGFCASLLRERPVEAGVDPGFEVADAPVQKVLFEEAFHEFLDLVAEEGGGALGEAFAAGMSLDQLRGLCRGVVDQRDLFADERFAPPAPEAPGLARLAAALQATLAHLETTVGQCQDPDDLGLRQIESLRRLAESLEGLDEAAAEQELLAGLPGKVAGNQKNWSDKEVLKENKRRVEELAAQRDEHARARIAVRAARVLAEARRLPAIYERAKERRRALDFQDLLIKTRDLLRRDLDARRDFQRRFASILLDEFQDTDPLQAEIAFFLAEDPESEPAREWSAVRVGRGRLFLVGDPKQSIYRFRRADIEVYEQARAALERSGGEVLFISVNFRSSPAILRWVNERFAALIRRPESGERYQPDYVPIEAPSGRAEGAPGVVLLAGGAPDGGYGSIGEARAAEAHAVAAFLKSMVAGEGAAAGFLLPLGDGEARRATFGDCALLFRTMTALSTYEDVLRAHGVPYRVAAGKHLYARAEVKAAVALFRAIDDPSDDIAQAAVLRGPLFGLSDEDLMNFRAAGGRFSDLEDGPAATPPAVREARALLRGLSERRHQSGLAEFVVEALARTRALELFHLRPMGEQRAANLLKFVDLARTVERTEGRTLRAFVAAIRDMERAGGEEAEAALLDGGGDAVQLLTMHKAKGLEFPVVVLADLGAELAERDTFLFDRGPPPRVAFAAGGKKARLLETPGFEALAQWDALRAGAELCRLFYVAATRARALLVLPRFPVAGKKAEKGLAGLLDGDPVYSADPGAEGARSVDASRLALDPGAEQPFRLEIDPEAAAPPAARAVLERRRAFHEELRALFSSPAHRRRVSSASAEKEAVDHRFAGAAGAARPAGAAWRGVEFGTLVHGLMERVDFRAADADVEALARALALQQGLPPEAAAEACALVQDFLRGDLAVRIRAARRFDREVPFVHRDGDLLLEGAIDLVAEELARRGARGS